LYLARLHGAHTLLGSATPSLESWHNAQQNRFGFAQLTERYGGVQLPEILVVDVKDLTRKKLMHSHFSPQLLEETEKALNNKEQVILFQNRRGFSPCLECADCAHVPQCTRCDVSLTYHKQSDQLRCHYCGYTMKPPTTCEACGSTRLETKGFGTEKIEEELSIFFPKARIARMDLDTTRAKNAHRNIINGFEEGEIDILVGTQMVTKGLDFGNVALVGILHADGMLHYPDFRSWERSYQLMAQVAGRAGRKQKRGRVIIQTFSPTHEVINYVVENNYEGLAAHQLQDRLYFHYPPFYRLIEFTLKGKDFDMLQFASDAFAKALRQHFGDRVLGPKPPPVARVRDEYLRTILIKIEREASSTRVRQILEAEITLFKARKDFAKIRIVPDVDPV
jgi:primosomal protein N' (replication factor Y)